MTEDKLTADSILEALHEQASSTAGILAFLDSYEKVAVKDATLTSDALTQDLAFIAFYHQESSVRQKALQTLCAAQKGHISVARTMLKVAAEVPQGAPWYATSIAQDMIGAVLKEDITLANEAVAVSAARAAISGNTGAHDAQETLALIGEKHPKLVEVALTKMIDAIAKKGEGLNSYETRKALVALVSPLSKKALNPLSHKDDVVLDMACLAREHSSPFVRQSLLSAIGSLVEEDPALVERAYLSFIIHPIAENDKNPDVRMIAQETIYQIVKKAPVYVDEPKELLDWELRVLASETNRGAFSNGRYALEAMCTAWRPLIGEPEMEKITKIALTHPDRDARECMGYLLSDLMNHNAEHTKIVLAVAEAAMDSPNAVHRAVAQDIVQKALWCSSEPNGGLACRIGLLATGDKNGKVRKEARDTIRRMTRDDRNLAGVILDNAHAIATIEHSAGRANRRAFKAARQLVDKLALQHPALALRAAPCEPLTPVTQRLQKMAAQL